MIDGTLLTLAIYLAINLAMIVTRRRRRDRAELERSIARLRREVSASNRKAEIIRLQSITGRIKENYPEANRHERRTASRKVLRRMQREIIGGRMPA